MITLMKRFTWNNPMCLLLMDNKKKACKLVKSLNGLKQAPKQMT